MGARPYQLDFFEDDGGGKPCLRWIKGLTEAKRHAIGVAMEQILQAQGVSVCEEKAWGKQLGAGKSRLRGSAYGDGSRAAAQRNDELDVLWVMAHNPSLLPFGRTR